MKRRDIAVIAQDGRRTYARVIGPDGIKSGEANCHVGDTYRPEIGAVIALCRAYETHPEKVAYDVMDVFAKDKAEKATGNGCVAGCETPVRKHNERKKNMKGTPAHIARKEGKLHLTAFGEGMGRPGTPTMFKDANGKVLFVGDLVTVKVLSGEVRTGRKWVDAPGLTFVVDDESDDAKCRGQYIMGLLSGCNEKTGKIDGHFKVYLAKRWQEVEVGEEHHSVKLEWEGEADGV